MDVSACEPDRKECEPGTRRKGEPVGKLINGGVKNRPSVPHDFFFRDQARGKEESCASQNLPPTPAPS